MGEDLTNSPSNIPQIAEQHTEHLSQLLTYAGSPDEPWQNPTNSR